MLRRAFFVLLVVGLAGTIGSATPGRFSLRAVAQVTPPAYSCFFAGLNQFNNLINSGIQCFTPGPAPSSSGTFSVLACSGLASCAPSSGPSPSIYVPSPNPSATGCGTWAWAWPNVSLNTTGCSGGGGGISSITATAPIVASPIPSGFNISCPTCLTGTGFVVLQAPGTTPSPQVGFASLTSGLVIGPTPAPNSTYEPNALQISTSHGMCTSSGAIVWGTNNAEDTVNGVPGDTFWAGCLGGLYALFSVDSTGDIGTAGNIEPGGSDNIGLILQNTGLVEFETSSTADQPCTLQSSAGWTGVALRHTASGTCTLDIADLTPLSALCSDSSANHSGIIPCPNNIGNAAYEVSVTTASACTAFVSCGTITYSFSPNAYSVAPYCSRPAVQDSTAVTQLWDTGISAESGSSITFTYGPLVTTGSAHNLTLTFTCGQS